MRVAEGAEGNLRQALATNATHLTQDEFREVNRLRQELLLLSRVMRDKAKALS